MGPRRKAREYALQMLFQWDITHDSIDQILSTFFNGLEESEAVADFARTLVIRAVENVEKIDSLIQRNHLTGDGDERVPPRCIGATG